MPFNQPAFYFLFKLLYDFIRRECETKCRRYNYRLGNVISPICCLPVFFLLIQVWDLWFFACWVICGVKSKGFDRVVWAFH